MIRFYRLKPGISTRTLLAVIRSAHDQALREFDLDPVGSHEARRRTRREVRPGVRSVCTRYTFGIHTSTRDTMTVTYEVGTGEVGVVFPDGYTGWDRAGVYDRLRVRVHDLIVHHVEVRDKSAEPRVTGGAA